jgi:hypothetical protein
MLECVKIKPTTQSVPLFPTTKTLFPGKEGGKKWEKRPISVVFPHFFHKAKVGPAQFFLFGELRGL